MTIMRAAAVKNITMNITSTTMAAVAKNMRIITNRRRTAAATSTMSTVTAMTTIMKIPAVAAVAAAGTTIPTHRIKTKERCCWAVRLCLPQA